MVTILAKIFIKDSEDKIKQREAYGAVWSVYYLMYCFLSVNFLQEL